MEIADTPAAEGAETFRPAGHDMACRNVGFAYDEKEALHGVSFTAKEGEVTALVDPSGLGKRTCVRLAARLWDLSEGTSTAGGVDILTVDPEALLCDYSMVCRSPLPALFRWRANSVFSSSNGFLFPHRAAFDIFLLSGVRLT